MTTNRRSFQRVTTFDDTDSVNDATDLLFMEHYISGSHPFAQSAYIARVRDGASLIPHGVDPIRVAVSDGTQSVLVSGPDWILCTTKWADGSARVSVAAQSDPAEHSGAAPFALGLARRRSRPDPRATVSL